MMAPAACSPRTAATVCGAHRSPRPSGRGSKVVLLAAVVLAFAFLEPASAQISFPSQCSSYTVINDPTREVTYGVVPNQCDNGFFSTSTWYRFSDMNGFNFVPTAPPAINTCGATLPGWLSGVYPYPGATTPMTMYFSNGNAQAYSSGTWAVTQCNGFYVYNPSSGVTVCYARVCTTNVPPAGFGVGCSNYTTISDVSRETTYSGITSGSDYGVFTANSWYRFADGLGFNFVPTAPPSPNSCGGNFPGWLNGNFPALSGATSAMTMYFVNGASTQYWQQPWSVTQCNGFYTYSPTGSGGVSTYGSNLRVCTSNIAPSGFVSALVSAPPLPQCGAAVQMPAPFYPVLSPPMTGIGFTLYHGWPSPVPGCSTLGYNTFSPTQAGGFFPYYTTDSVNCLAWKLAATICPTPPAAAGWPGFSYSATGNYPAFTSSALSAWTCPTAAGVNVVDPYGFGSFCPPTGNLQVVCADANVAFTTNGVTSTTCGPANYYSSPTGLSIRNCAGNAVTQSVSGWTGPASARINGTVLSSGDALFFNSSYATANRSATSCTNAACPSTQGTVPFGKPYDGGYATAFPTVPVTGCGVTTCSAQSLAATYTRNPVRVPRLPLIIFLQLTCLWPRPHSRMFFSSGSKIQIVWSRSSCLA